MPMTEEEQFVVDSQMNWKPLESMQRLKKHSKFDDLKTTRAELFWIFWNFMKR